MSRKTVKKGKSGEKDAKNAMKREKILFLRFLCKQNALLHRKYACICISDNYSIIADRLAFVPISLA